MYAYPESMPLYRRPSYRSMRIAIGTGAFPAAPATGR